MWPWCPEFLTPVSMVNDRYHFVVGDLWLLSHPKCPTQTDMFIGSFKADHGADGARLLPCTWLWPFSHCVLFVCMLCVKLLTSLHSVCRLIVNHPMPRKLNSRCTVCGLVSSAGSIRRHLRRMHGESASFESCTVYDDSGRPPWSRSPSQHACPSGPSSQHKMHDSEVLFVGYYVDVCVCVCVCVVSVCGMNWSIFCAQYPARVPIPACGRSFSLGNLRHPGTCSKSSRWPF